MKNLTPNITITDDIIDGVLGVCAQTVCGACVYNALFGCENEPKINRYWSGDVFSCFEVEFNDKNKIGFLYTTDGFVHGRFDPDVLGFGETDQHGPVTSDKALELIRAARSILN